MTAAQRQLAAPEESWPRGLSHEPVMSIGLVLDTLRSEFPDVTLSKLRFLEVQGLVTPRRTPSGYRKYSQSDVGRLRFVLTAQRDEYLPLKVIRSRLEALDAGTREEVVPKTSVREADGVRGDPRQIRLTIEELSATADLSVAEIRELVDIKLLVPRSNGLFDGTALSALHAVRQLRDHGIEARHLRAFVIATDKETNLIQQIVTPLTKQRGAGARAQAETTANELGELCANLHAALIRAAIARST